MSIDFIVLGSSPANGHSSAHRRPITRRPRRPSPRAAAREARNDVYRQHILEAGEQVFAEHGFDTAKVQDISRLAGLSMGTIYAIFPSKEQIYASILEQRGHELLLLVQGIASADLDARSRRSTRWSTTYIDYFVAHPDFLRMHLRTGASWALRHERPGHARAALRRHDPRPAARASSRAASPPACSSTRTRRYLGVLFSGIDQVLLADWVAGGMKASRDELRERLLRVVRKTFLR